MSIPTFKRVSLQQFEKILANFPFTRRINAVHMHHTWRPARSDFKGHETIVAMWRYHTQEMGWRDIAQHITIDPEGDIWLGRNWNLPPASAAGHNGNANVGPFMFEMIGNFDRGHDVFDGQQRETALQVVALVQDKFGLPPTTLMFHNALSPKSCPGSGIDYTEVLAEVEARRAAIRARPESTRERRLEPFPDQPDVNLREAIDALRREPLDRVEPADAELSHHETGTALEEALDARFAGGAARDARDVSLSPELLAALRPYIVNLTMGHFSSEGRSASSAADVDAIFEQHLPKELAEAAADNRKLRIVFYAHGGLVSESSGLQIAMKHIDWWRRNHIYPIYFIWKTGFFETVANLLQRSRAGAMRGLARDFWDVTTDPLIELAARVLNGDLIWSGMKSAAEHAIDEPTETDKSGGGAWYVANKLKAFLDKHPGDVELHAVGHSAGSIFHSYFLTLAHDLGVRTFNSAHFLAPAVRVDTFKQLLGSRIGQGKAIEKLTLFTMKKDYEKADNCAEIYHKSLLYLIYYALEAERATPILGLEECLRSDPQMKSLFGLGGAASPPPDGEVVWSVTEADSGRAASHATAHGDFDDDAATMNSIARRILHKEDADSIVDYGAPRAIALARRAWADEVDWPEDLARPAAPAPAFDFGAGVPPASPSPAWTGGAATQAAWAGAAPGASRRLALCIGIDRYPNPRHQLAGCVADARMWADALTKLGFSATLLVDGQATRETLARELQALVRNSRAGDVIVFQYAGHGTMVPDLNGDETDGQDEAICPVDFADGALYIDDDIAQVLDQLPDGVNLTCFMDCCHSGTNTRFAVGAPLAIARAGRDERKRYVEPTPELVAAHVRFRQQMGGAQRRPGTGGRSLMPDIKFSACLDSEVAWESDGHGEFTLRATRVLAAGLGGLTNDQFIRRVIADFGVGTRQHPMLDCSPGTGSRPLLQPLARDAVTASQIAAAAPGGMDGALLGQAIAALQQLQAQIAAR